jgi:hypothetical protein
VGLNLGPETTMGKCRENCLTNRNSNDFLNNTQVVHKIRERIDKWDYIKLKSSLQQKNQSTE